MLALAALALAALALASRVLATDALSSAAVVIAAVLGAAPTEPGGQCGAPLERPGLLGPALFFPLALLPSALRWAAWAASRQRSP